jgi:hypothetical protein
VKKTKDPFFQNLPSLCNVNPKACDSFLQDYLCKNVKRTDLVNDPLLMKLCACFLQSEEYPFKNYFGAQCDPLCNSAVFNTVKKTEPADSGWIPSVCKQNICVVDDVIVDAASSQLGGVNIEQICPAIGANGSSQCYLSNTTIEAVNSKITGGIDMYQACSSCSNGPGQPGTCNDDGGLSSLDAPSKVSIGVIGFVIFIILLMIVWFVI